MRTAVLITLAGIVAGAAAGWIYWRNFGCTGSCMITSKPINSTLYGALIGGLLINSIQSIFNKKR